MEAGPRPWSAFLSVTQQLPFGLYLRNSVWVSGLVALSQVISSALAGYVFGRLKFWGRDALFFLFLGTLFIPEHVTILPTFILLRWMNLLDSHAALILPALAHPFGVFLVRQYFRGMPDELEDAARIDGCSRLGVLGRIILPASGPALATVGLFSFLWSWNSFLWPLMVLQSPDRLTMQVGLSMLRSEIGTDWPTIIGAALLSLLPLVILFVAAHRLFWRNAVLRYVDW